MIRDNDNILFREIIEYYVQKLLDSGRSYNLKLTGTSDTDSLSNGKVVETNPMIYRDDNFFTNTNLYNLLQLEYDNIIDIETINNICKEIYKVIIRFGTINYKRYHKVENSSGSFTNELRKETSTKVIFNESSIASGFSNYNRIKEEANNINILHNRNNPVTNETINEFINSIINTALSKEKYTLNIEELDCFTAHNDCDCNCYSGHDDCDYVCRGGCHCNQDCNCWGPGTHGDCQNIKDCYVPGY